MRASVLEAGRVVVVGGTRGIGAAIANKLAHDNDVTTIGRSESSNAAVKHLRADMALLSEVRRVAERLLEDEAPIDLLVHSADILAMSRIETSEGFERSFALNYLSRFSLNIALQKSMRRARRPRIVHIAAAGFPGKLDLDHFPPPDSMSSFRAHNIGQRSNDCHVVEFQRRYPSGIEIYNFNPGRVATTIREQMSAPWFVRAMASLVDSLLPPMTVDTFVEQVFRTISKGQSGLFDAHGNTVAHTVSPALGTEVWDRTARLVDHHA